MSTQTLNWPNATALKFRWRCLVAKNYFDIDSTSRPVEQL